MKVYLIHFETRYKHAGHYLGATTLSIEERLKRHTDERGAKLMKAVINAGIKYYVSRVWKCKTKAEAFELEKKFKVRSNTRICPICQWEAKIGC